MLQGYGTQYSLSQVKEIAKGLDNLYKTYREWQFSREH